MTVEEIFQEYGIQYVVGPAKNVGNGKIGLNCPYCRDDLSQHMAVDPEAGWYNCWRNKMHGGRNLARLLVDLIPGLSYSQAVQMTESKPLLKTDFATQLLHTMNGTALVEKEPVSVELPESAHFVLDGSMAAARGLEYLQSRGISEDVADLYNLHFALLGRCAHRLIVPIYERNQLLTYTARAVTENSRLRYWTLPEKESRRGIRDCLLGIDVLERLRDFADVLFLCEGPFDALKIMTVCNYGIHATCLFGLRASNKQLALLREEVIKPYRKVCILLDPGMVAQTLDVVYKLGSKVVARSLVGDRDPGDLAEQEIIDLAKDL